MNHFTKLAGLGLAATLFFTACEKDEDRAVMQPGSALSLTSSTNSITLLQANATANAVTYTWNAVSFGYPAAVQYTIQFDKKGGAFTAPVEIEAGSSTSRTLTVSELNAALIRLKMTPGSAGNADVRIKATVGGNTTPVYSAVSSFTGTPYLVFIDYPSVYVPGSHQGWAPDKAPALASVANNKEYEGYVNFPNANDEFKITPARNWDNDFGADAAGAAGSLKAKGDNIKITQGYYRLKVNLNTLKYTADKTTWSIIGAATPGGWDNDTPLVYDATKHVWTATVTLKADEMKFRANNGWDINYGDNDADNMPDFNGKNIKVPAAGTYTVTLDLSKGDGNYSYTIEK